MEHVFCHGGNKLIMSEHESTASSDAFTAEMVHGLNHVSNNQELLLSQMTRYSKRQKDSRTLDLANSDYCYVIIASAELLLYAVYSDLSNILLLGHVPFYC